METNLKLECEMLPERLHTCYSAAALFIAGAVIFLQKYPQIETPAEEAAQGRGGGLGQTCKAFCFPFPVSFAG